MKTLSLRSLALTAALAVSVNAGINAQGKPVKVLGDDVPMDDPNQFWSQLQNCPLPCDNQAPSNWTLYSSLEEASLCSEPMMLSFNVYSPTTPGHTVRLSACTVSDEGPKHSSKKTGAPKKDVFTSPEKRGDDTCLGTLEEHKQDVELFRIGSQSDKSQAVIESLQSLTHSLEQQVAQTKDCKPSFLIAYTNGTVAGTYVGPAVTAKSIKPWTQSIVDQVKKQGSSERLVSQICTDKMSSTHIIGVSVDTSGNLEAVQQDLRAWADAKCADVKGQDPTSLPSVTLLQTHVGASNRTGHSNGTLPTKHAKFRRGQCKLTQVYSGDSCALLAGRCGVTLSEFAKFNSDSNICSSLKPGQMVCCSAGAMPDQKPKPKRDGACKVQHISAGDNCDKYARQYNITIDDLDKYNDGKTWGWTGCGDSLAAGIDVCVSDGTPPLPAPVANAVCGPTKPGTETPTDGTAIEDLNPCPLNACCNIWGQCGISGEFCVKSDGPRKSPGTAPEGVNGCVSSCGQEIVKSSSGPAKFGRVGYYESWNFNRECLNMRASNANTDGSYTTIHWAFASINTKDWTVDKNDKFNQWDLFKGIPNVRKVVSFGGWGYSTEPETYDILRQAMSPANRQKFASNVLRFIDEEKLDGVDFDWEYPGATDIDGTPAGSPDDGAKYLIFLTIMKQTLNRYSKDKTLSIAAPASFWYLKAFPIKAMAQHLDYIVYMTYDLHGQWDAGNKWAQEGCPTGNCLRSHVNGTETLSVLAMITKAGVPSNQIYVGESSYGRSFKMAREGCNGPMCNFLGDRLHSQAAKGRCTDTAGYIADAEIKEILANNDNAKTVYEESSQSNILLYDDTEWVAYMDESTKLARRLAWTTYNFAGTIDWAVDLQDFTGDDGFLSDDDFPEQGTPRPIPDCDGSYTNLDDVPVDADEYCRNLYILQVLRHDMSDAINQYDKLLGEGYEKKFKTYAEAVSRSGNKAIESFMWKQANNYFQCSVLEIYNCCAYCDYTWGKKSNKCLYCSGKCGGWSAGCDLQPAGCGETPENVANITGPCPPDYSKRTEDPVKDGHYAFASIYWQMRDGKEDAFYADLLTNTGITKDNVEFKDMTRAECLPPTLPKNICQAMHHDFNFPVTHDYTADKVANPEDLVKNAYKNITGLVTQMDAVIDQMHAKVFGENSYDVVSVMAFTVQTVTDAVGAMQKIEDTVDKWDDDKRKNIIIAFLTAIFLFIPVVGEVVGAIAEMANIARIAALAGTIGNVALDIYGIVDSPDNLALAIFGLILEPIGLLDVIKVEKAAISRRLAKADDLKKLHKDPGGKVSKVDHIQTTCPIGKKRGVLTWNRPKRTRVAVWPEPTY